MKNKIFITKSIAALLCIITITVSLNIYLSYKDLYVSHNSTSDSIIYIAAAKTSLKNSNIPTNTTSKPIVEIEEISRSKSVVSPNKEDVQQRIFINILILFLCFISLASIHNFMLGTETDKRYNSKILLDTALIKTSDINSTSSSIFKEGVK